ncbi:MAG: GntR family transcriptional regulator [Candidatus Dormiibacterota bacterium]
MRARGAGGTGEGGGAVREVAAAIRTGLREGTLGTGTRLGQAALAALYGTSRGVAHQAMTVLVEDSLATFDGPSHIVLIRPRVADVVENFEIRIALECLAIELAATRLTEADLVKLRSLLPGMRATLTPERMRETGRLNPQFHRVINEAAARPLLLRLIEEARQTGRAFHALLYDPPDVPYRDELQGEHEAICAALEERDGERASTLLRAHLAHNQDRILGMLRVPDEDARAPDEDAR